MERDKNIFETASKKLAKKKPPTTGPAKQEAVPLTPVPDSDPQTQEKEIVFPSTRNKDPEIKAMMNQIQTMRQDLQNKLDKIYTASGMTPEKLKKFLDNPKNFNPKDWDFVQKNKHFLEIKVWDTLGEELKPMGKFARENVSGERKGKTLGARKKWIPIH